MKITNYPKVSFCGLGDPLLHPEIDKLIFFSKKNGFYTQLVTNGLNLTENILKKLIAAGLDEIAVSLHSVNSRIYKDITGMNVDVVKNNLKKCSELIKNHAISLSLWRIYHVDIHKRDSTVDQEMYYEFVNSLNIDNVKILGPSEPWSRDEYVKQSLCSSVNDSPFWCNKIPFTFNLDWEGNVVLCCNDYNNEKVKLGNAFLKNYDYDALFCYKKEILTKKRIPNICIKCRRWADNEIIEILESYGYDINTFLKNIGLYDIIE